MERDGQLVFTRRQCYALPERLDLVKGIVIGHRDGYGFLRVEGRKDDLYLSSEQMKTAFMAIRCWLSRWALTVKVVVKRRIVHRVLVPKPARLLVATSPKRASGFVVP